MPNDSPEVVMHKPGGRNYVFPRQSMNALKARGWMEVTQAEDEEKKTPFSVEFGKEVTRGMGFDPEKAERMELDPSGHRHPVRGALELANQFMKGGAKWMESVAKDPFKITEPIEATATGVEKGLSGVWKELTEDDDPSIRKLGFALARLAGASSVALAGSEKGETFRAPVRAAMELPGKVGEIPKAVSREVLGVTAKDVEKARKPVEQRAAELRAAHEEKVSQARTKNRAAYEAEEAEKKSEYAKEVGKAEKERIEQSKIEGQRASLEAVQERYSKQIAGNLDKAEKMEKLSLDSEWEDFRKRVLGVSKEAPNGTLQSNLTAVGKAVLDAKKAIVKGSDTNIPIFKDLMGRFSEMVDTPEGAVPLEGQMIPTDQLRGYIRELDDKIYGSELPADIRNAMKHVSEVANREVESAIKDVHGKTTAAAYRALKDRYADYLETWKDKSSGSPVPKIRALLREPISTRRGVPVYREVADILRGKDGEKIIATLARKRAFGADTSTIAKLRSAAQKLKELPSPKEVSRPQRPEPATSAKIEAPKPPDIEKFDADKFIRDAAESRAKSISRWGTAGAIAWMIRDMVHGNIPSPGLVAAPVVQHFLMRAMTSKKFLDWITEGIPKGGVS
jgi:hypothetical protein